MLFFLIFLQTYPSLSHDHPYWAYGGDWPCNLSPFTLWIYGWSLDLSLLVICHTLFISASSYVFISLFPIFHPLSVWLGLYCFHCDATHIVAQKSVPILSYFEKIRKLWDIKKELGKALARWMKVLVLGIPKLLWSCDLVAMKARYRHFKMTCHWDTYLTLYYNMDFSILYALPLLVSLPQAF